MSRKGAKSDKRPAKPDETQNADAATGSVLPMEIQIGDRFTDHDFELADGRFTTCPFAKTPSAAKWLICRL